MRQSLTRGDPFAKMPPLTRRWQSNQISHRTLHGDAHSLDESAASAGHNCLFHCLRHPANVSLVAMESLTDARS
jgi:hypothetical protein